MNPKTHSLQASDRSGDGWGKAAQPRPINGNHQKNLQETPEIVHLLERHHNDRFQGFMDRFLPAWRLRKQELNRTPLAHEKWQY